MKLDGLRRLTSNHSGNSHGGGSVRRIIDLGHSTPFAIGQINPINIAFFFAVGRSKPYSVTQSRAIFGDWLGDQYGERPWLEGSRQRCPRNETVPRATRR